MAKVLVVMVLAIPTVMNNQIEEGDHMIHHKLHPLLEVVQVAVVIMEMMTQIKSIPLTKYRNQQK